MSIFFDQDFDGEPLGSVPSPFFTTDLGGGVTAPGWNGTPNAFDLNLGGLCAPITESAAITVFCVYKYGPNADPTGSTIINLENGDPDDLSAARGKICRVIFELDRTLSVYVAEKFIANSGIPILTDDWTFIQLNCTFSAVGSFLAATVSLTLYGIIVIAGTAVSNTLVSSLFTGQADANFVEFRAAGAAGSTIDSVLAEDLVEENDYPYPGTPFGRITQAVFEVAELPTNSHGRVTQTAIEWIKFPTNSHARITQAVIELITVRQASVNNWMISES